MGKRKKMVVEKIGEREVKYFLCENNKGECYREYIAIRKLKRLTNTEDGYTLFDVELPSESLKDVPYVGVFHGEKEVYSYLEYMHITGRIGEFVGWLKDEDESHYILVSFDEMSNQRIYSITATKN